MDSPDLLKLFLSTALATLAVVAVAMPFSPDWAGSYAFLGTLALANWIALSATLSGIVLRRPVPAIMGIMAKPLLLTILVIYAVRVGIEITSFLAAVNTFLVCALIQIAQQARVAPQPCLLSGSEAHG